MAMMTPAGSISGRRSRRAARGHYVFPAQRALVAHDDDVPERGQLAAQALDHGAVIALAEGSGHEDQLRAAVGKM